MPSKDPIKAETNVWMGEQAPGIVQQGLAIASPKPKKKDRPMAAQILRLAKRLGRDPDELAAELPEDTIRRLKYPVLEHVEKDGSRAFDHDIGIQVDGRLSRP
jgi:hypothetical protein